MDYNILKPFIIHEVVGQIGGIANSEGWYVGPKC